MIQSIHQSLTSAWLRRGWLACLLWPFSQIYFLLLLLHRWGYRHFEPDSLPVPVLVVGNVVVGGAGKTPVVMALIEHFKKQGLTVGVVSRGYGRTTTGVIELSAMRSAFEVGDEPLLIHKKYNLPVYVGEDRSAAVLSLCAAHPDVKLIISDDGLQHLHWHYDFSICVFDQRGLGNGWLLPAGPLRSPWPIKPRANTIQWIAVAPSCRDVQGHTLQRFLSDVAINGRGEQKKLSDWQGLRVSGLAGIANPSSFFEMLTQRGLSLDHTFSLPDHADLSHWQMPTHSTDLLCTEKDAVKLWDRFPQIWAVPLVCVLSPQMLQEIDREVRLKLSSNHGH
ncbi:MAG: tetraacyldisaccharide 4'-kinase [Limnohabitans sp.]|nr:tetraacyldisaccharide 4'-kinase [Limnohabitans sp.]